MGPHEHNNLDFTEKSFEETKDRINSQIMALLREEQNLYEQIKKLELEKISCIQETKRINNEYHSRFGKPNPRTGSPEWPILDNKYQILSLIGKGGFSEVYKAFDLEGLRYCACKIHQSNPNWEECAKENYIKHVI